MARDSRSCMKKWLPKCPMRVPMSSCRPQLMIVAAVTASAVVNPSHWDIPGPYHIAQAGLESPHCAAQHRSKLAV